MEKMRKSKFSLSGKYRRCVVGLALIIAVGGITHNRDVEATEGDSSVAQEELEMVFGKQQNVIDIFSSDVMVGNQGVDNKLIHTIRPNYNIKFAQKYQNLTYALCEKNNIPYTLALAFFHSESEFNPNAINWNGTLSYDSGISQTNSKFEEFYRERAIQYCDLPKNVVFDPMNPDHSIRAGIGGLVHWLKVCQSMKLSEKNKVIYALGIYNRGEKGMRDYIRDNKTFVTPYSIKILKKKEKLETSNTLI